MINIDKSFMKAINFTAEDCFHSNTTVYSNKYLYYAHIYFTYVAKIVHEDYTVFSGVKATQCSFSLVAGCMFAINIVRHPNIYKIQGN